MTELDTALYANEPAWHRKGRVTAGTFTANDALTDGGLGWQVGTEPVYLAAGECGLIEVPNLKAIVRTDLARNDARRVLGSASDRYEVIQNAVPLALAEAVIGESGAVFETAGSLRNGRIVYCTAHLPEPVRVKDDIVERYVLFTAHHDGTGALVGALTGVRVVCWNTLSWALSGSRNKVKIRHTANAKQRVAQAKELLKAADDHYTKMGQSMRELADRRVSDAFVDAYLKALVPDPKDPDACKTHAENKRAKITGLFNGEQKGATQEAVDGTAYGLVQAVAEFADHHSTVRQTNGRSADECRMESVLLGSGMDFKDRSLSTLLKCIDLEQTAHNMSADQVLDGVALN